MCSKGIISYPICPPEKHLSGWSPKWSRGGWTHPFKQNQQFSPPTPDGPPLTTTFLLRPLNPLHSPWASQLTKPANHIPLPRLTRAPYVRLYLAPLVAILSNSRCAQLHEYSLLVVVHHMTQNLHLWPPNMNVIIPKEFLTPENLHPATKDLWVGLIQLGG